MAWYDEAIFITFIPGTYGGSKGKFLWGTGTSVKYVDPMDRTYQKHRMYSSVYWSSV